MSDPQIPTTPTSKARDSLNDYPIRTGELRQRVLGGSPFSRHADTTQAAATELAQERYPKVSASDGPDAHAENFAPSAAVDANRHI
jgi:hypothetical protein